MRTSSAYDDVSFQLEGCSEFPLGSPSFFVLDSFTFSTFHALTRFVTIGAFRPT